MRVVRIRILGQARFPAACKPPGSVAPPHNSVDMDRLAELQAQQAALREQVAGARQRVKAAKQKTKDDAKKSKKVWVLTESLRRVALIAFCLSNYATAPAVEFLAGAAAKRKWPVKTEEELAAMVEEIFLKADLQEVEELCDLRNPKDLAAAREGVRFSEQWRLADWVQRLNFGSGVAPSTETVLQRLEAERLRLPELVRPASRGSAAEPWARMWALRWRRRWGAKHGKVRLKSDVGVEECREKAIAYSFLTHPQMRVMSVGVGTGIRSRVGRISGPGDQNPVPKSRPDSGPKIGTGIWCLLSKNN